VEDIEGVGGGHRKSLVEGELGCRGWREPRSKGWRGRRGTGVTGSERGGMVGGGSRETGRRGHQGRWRSAWAAAAHGWRRRGWAQ
jgi:hypothetical protein